jgi:hypothetical protein
VGDSRCAALPGEWRGDISNSIIASSSAGYASVSRGARAVVVILMLFVCCAGCGESGSLVRHRQQNGCCCGQLARRVVVLDECVVGNGVLLSASRGVP